MMGRSIFDFMDAEAQAIAVASLERRRQGINEQLDFRYIRKDGSHLWALLETSALLDCDGKYGGALAMLTDITKRKHAEQQAQLQMERLKALRTIDIAIGSSFDLRLTLDILLNQVVTLLDVDAASILLYHPHTKMLENAASRGFRSPAIRNTRVMLGDGFAGRAILERRTIRIPNLLQTDSELGQALLFSKEDFVDYYCVPLLTKGEMKGALEIFQRSPLTGNEEWLDFLETLAGQVAIAIENSQLFEGLQRSNIELSLAYDATIEGWSAALDLRDKETEGHSQRVTEMTMKLAHVMGVGETDLIQVRRGALLHDIGKLGIPDHILLKPGILADEEWEIMRKHPTYAYEMLFHINYLKPALDIPYCHHEKWDGTGYPQGLKGEQIPLVARIFAIVDVWDAVTSERPYRAAWSKEKALEFIMNEAGKHFDPQVVSAFVKLIVET
jgi:putative nucleotidyltransferase with HDIG domain